MTTQGEIMLKLNGSRPEGSSFPSALRLGKFEPGLLLIRLLGSYQNKYKHGLREIQEGIR
jgi:hypothetical protein